MRAVRSFPRYLLAWSVVSLLNAVLNGYVGELPSLAYRGVALGLLLSLAAAFNCLERPPRPGEPEQIVGALYTALFAAIGLPSVAWRWLAPLDSAGLASLRHGASIMFVFGVGTLAAVRLLHRSADRAWRTAKIDT